MTLPPTTHQAYQPFPKLNTPVLTGNNQLNVVWYRLLIRMWQAIGGSNALPSLTLPSVAAGTDTVAGEALTTANLALGYSEEWIVVTQSRFGAKGDGTTDDTAAFKAAIAYAAARGGGTVWVPVPPTSYVITSTLVLPTRVSLVGDPSKSLFTPRGGFTLLSIAGSDVQVKNLAISNAFKTAGVDVSIDCGASALNRIVISDILATGSFGFLADSGVGSSGIYVSLWVLRVQALGVQGNGFAMTRAYAFIVYEDCVCDFPGSANANFVGFILDNSVLSGLTAVGGSYFTRCNTGGTSTGSGALGNQVGFLISNTAAVWVVDCIADTCDYYGWEVTNVEYFHMVDSEASICNNFGMIFTGCSFVDLQSVRVGGRNTLAGSTLNADGLIITSCAHVNISSPMIAYCTGNGIFITNSTYQVLSGGQTSFNTLAGIVVAGSGVQAFLGTGLQMAGNAGGNYSLGSAVQFLQACQNSAGALVNVEGPTSG